MRALVVIPVAMGVLFAVLLVSACIGESPQGEVMGEGGRRAQLFAGLASPIPLLIFFSLSRKGGQEATE